MSSGADVKPNDSRPFNFIHSQSVGRKIEMNNYVAAVYAKESPKLCLEGDSHAIPKAEFIACLPCCHD